MANEEHLRILKKGVGVWNEWRKTTSEMADLSRTDLRRADLRHANLSNADLFRLTLLGANLSAANLSGAHLSCADVSEASLREADLSEANLIGADFTFADLSRTNLSEANIRYADLRRANLSEADISNAVLSSVNVSGADLSKANLSGADLRGAILCSADLRGADLSGADFSGADLRGAAFFGACLSATILGQCDLRMMVGLDAVMHKGPSTVGIDTIYLSEGHIPESFLRGCGVPESFILQMRALIGAEEGMQFHSCFISYSHKDEEFAKRLHERMRAANLRVWYAPEDMKGGGKIHDQIETQIHAHDKLLLVLSEHSMASEWVATEVYHTRQREKKEGRQILFPIRLCPFEKIREWKCFDSDTGKDMAREVREYLIPDFSNWKNHDQFEANFAKLLRDLRNSEKP